MVWTGVRYNLLATVSLQANWCTMQRTFFGGKPVMIARWGGVGQHGAGRRAWHRKEPARIWASKVLIKETPPYPFSGTSTQDEVPVSWAFIGGRQALSVFVSGDRLLFFGFDQCC